MSGEAPPKSTGLVAGVITLVLAVLQLGAALYTGYLCGTLAAAMMAWVVPLVVGGAITLALFSGAVTAGILALVKNPRQYVAILGLVVSVLSFGGCYAGCDRGLRDNHCAHASPGDPKCVR